MCQHVDTVVRGGPKPSVPIERECVDQIGGKAVPLGEVGCLNPLAVEPKASNAEGIAIGKPDCALSLCDRIQSSRLESIAFGEDSPAAAIETGQTG